MMMVVMKATSSRIRPRPSDLFFRTMESEMSNTNALLDNTAEEAEDQEQDMDDLPDDIVELSAPGAGDDSENNVATAPAKDEEGKKKAPVWKKPDKKKKAGKKGGGGGPNKQKQKPKKKAAEAGAGEQEKAQVSEGERETGEGPSGRASGRGFDLVSYRILGVGKVVEGPNKSTHARLNAPPAQISAWTHRYTHRNHVGTWAWVSPPATLTFPCCQSPIFNSISILLSYTSMAVGLLVRSRIRLVNPTH